MRMKRIAGTIAAGTLALSGLGIVGASAAHADVVHEPCSAYYQASLSSGTGEQCFIWNGSGTRTINVDGWGDVCAAHNTTVYVQFSGGSYLTYVPNGSCAMGTIYQFSIYPN